MLLVDISPLIINLARSCVLDIMAENGTGWNLRRLIYGSYRSAGGAGRRKTVLSPTVCAQFLALRVESRLRLLS